MSRRVTGRFIVGESGGLDLETGMVNFDEFEWKQGIERQVIQFGGGPIGPVGGALDDTFVRGVKGREPSKLRAGTDYCFQVSAGGIYLASLAVGFSNGNVSSVDVQLAIFVASSPVFGFPMSVRTSPFVTIASFASNQMAVATLLRLDKWACVALGFSATATLGMRTSSYASWFELQRVADEPIVAPRRIGPEPL